MGFGIKDVTYYRMLLTDLHLQWHDKEMQTPSVWMTDEEIMERKVQDGAEFARGHIQALYKSLSPKDKLEELEKIQKIVEKLIIKKIDRIRHEQDLAMAKKHVEDMENAMTTTTPKHYESKIAGLDPRKVIEAFELGFNRGNVIKYTLRAGKKDGESELKDLKKALECIQHEITMLESIRNN